MAEYTIPKPYRDFYVTNPYIELKESNERLQRIVKSGYVATDSVNGATNQILTFDSNKYGFSITNEGVDAIPTTIDFTTPDEWMVGTIDTPDGSFDDSQRYRNSTKEYIPVPPGSTYSVSLNETTGLKNLYFVYYTSQKIKVGRAGWMTTPTYEIAIPENAQYLRLCLRYSDVRSFTPEEAFADGMTISLNLTSGTSTIDSTLKVSENVGGNLCDASKWEQGTINLTTGADSDSDSVIRSNDFIPVNSLSNLYFTYTTISGTGGAYIYEYDKNKNYLTYTAMESNQTKATIKLKEETHFIKIVLSNSITEKTPTAFIQNTSRISLTLEPMNVSENDTRIVTMPTLTELHIESNVPYHGYVFDLAE